MSSAAEPLAPLAELPGVAESVDAVRTAVDRVYGHRVMRRRSNEITSEAALRGARGSAALAGADWALEEVRRRTDFGVSGEPRTVGAALRLTAEAGQLLSVWRQSPLQVLARLHLLAGGGAEPHEAVGRPRRPGEAVEEPLVQLAVPHADEVAARLDGLARILIESGGAHGTRQSGPGRSLLGPSQGADGGRGVPGPVGGAARAGGPAGTPALVTAAVVHGELLALRPFRTYNGLVARTAERIVLVGSGLDPKAVCPAEAGHAELGRDAYLAALEGYVSGTPAGVAAWIAHCGRAIQLGARESTAVCEALQRGAA
ncbi:oxidoreductase [Streptomyces sp. B1866]|uniref:oxidoreductase n=1 Tax=Streptomyces sp. B1866 TaxID=3075431 RepID=UPI00288D3ED0|nr:oxidoreductase [Streptomyces sp. B1866]MDT3395160.1 oxidoreductase [Streptomyces sp. B1866]